MTERTIMTSIKLQKRLHFRIQKRVIEEGYGMKGKSKWIIEAIESFLRMADYLTLVDIADDMEDLTDMLSIRLPESLLKRIERATLHIRRQFPLIEGVKSNIIRASILQRLLTEPTSVTEV